MDKILVIGACGQLGSELTMALGQLFGNEQIVASDITYLNESISEFVFEKLDIMDAARLAEVIDTHTALPKFITWPLFFQPKEKKTQKKPGRST